MSPLAAGVRLGHYLVEGPIGAGGMGEVYRARDTRLDRIVAIKIIPAALADSPESRARFEREARVISSLNHPHICTLFDVGRQDDIEYLVMEFLEGETLARRLQRGPVPVPEAARLAAQVADALDRAHRQGIVHRDLKPANVMLTRSGAKLLDFGLARGAGLAATTDGLSNTPTMTTPLTTQGAIVGTLEYMAPEQLEGKDTDARTDIWAMGLLLYEMLTGRRAFQAPSQAGLIAAILERTPTPLLTLAPDCPPALARLVDRCLTKDPDDRWQSARDLMHDLREISGSAGASLPSGVLSGSSVSVAPPASVVTAKRSAIPGWALLLVAFGIGAAAMLAATVPLRRPVAVSGLLRFEMAPRNGLILNIPAEPSISPDGRRVAFVGIDSLGTRHLCVRGLDAVEARRLPGTEGVSLPFWSPDGQWIAFFAGEALRKVRVDGGNPVVIAAAPDARGGVWLPNDDILFAPNRQGGLERVNAGGGTREPITTPDANDGDLGHRYPALMSDGKHASFVSIHGDGQHRIKMVELATRTVADLGPTTSAVVPVPGYMLSLDTIISDETNLQVQPFNEAGRKLTGAARRIVTSIGSSNIGYPNVAANADLLLVQRISDIKSRLEWRDVRDGSRTVIGEETNVFELSLSPDGRRVAMMMGATFDLWVRDLEGGGRRRLTSDSGYKYWMTWSPDGRQLAYSQQLRGNNGGYEVRIKSVDGVGEARALFRGPGLFSSPMSWTADGRELLVCASDSTGTFQLYIVPVAGGGRARLHAPRPTGRDQVRLSPDGQWLAYLSSESGRSEVWIESYPDAATRFQASTNGAMRTEWVDEGRGLVYIDTQKQLWVIDVTFGGGLTLGSPRKSFLVTTDSTFPAFDVRGTRVLLPIPEWEAGSGSLEAILGWQALIPKS